MIKDRQIFGFFNNKISFLREIDLSLLRKPRQISTTLYVFLAKVIIIYELSILLYVIKAC